MSKSHECCAGYNRTEVKCGLLVGSKIYTKVLNCFMTIALLFGTRNLMLCFHNTYYIDNQNPPDLAFPVGGEHSQSICVLQALYPARELLSCNLVLTNFGDAQSRSTAGLGIARACR